MRLLIATPDFPPAHGGIQVLMERLAAELAARHDVTVLTLAQSSAQERDVLLPFDVVRVGRKSFRRAAIAELNAAIPVQAARLVPDVILAGHVVCGPGALLARARHSTPVVVYVHAMELDTFPRIVSTVLSRADAVIAVSSYSARLAAERGARAERVTVVFPGVDAAESAWEAPAVTGVIVTVARLHNRYKGFDVMLRALPLITAQVSNVTWVVVGDGPLRLELERVAETSGLSGHVRFVGSVSDSERDVWLRRASIFSMLSRVPHGAAGEGFGIAYLDAGRLGIPSVAGNVGGSAEAVVDGVTGTLVDPRDHISVSDEITKLLRDDELRLRYGHAARARAAELTWAKMATGVERVLQVVRPEPGFRERLGPRA